jgi:hypothetical protein
MSPHVLDGAPWFPAPPQEFWTGEADGRAIDTFLPRVLVWRDDLAAWLKAEQASEHLSVDLVDLLQWSIGERRGATLKMSPYALSVFPDGARTPASRGVGTGGAGLLHAAVRDVLIWRARLVDFLADVWDTIDTPLFDVDECRMATDLFMPAGHGDDRLCPYCLQEYGGPDRTAVHNGVCPLQRSVLERRS